MITYIIAAIVGLLVIGADQYTKYIVSTNFADSGSFPLIPRVINIEFLENDGIAWGMLPDKTWLHLSVTAVVMLICVALILKHGTKNKLLFWAMILVLSGGLGNMIDRIFRGGHVVDFLQFDFWKSYPVFNLADCAIVIGAGLLILYFVMDLFKEYKNKIRKPAPKDGPEDKDGKDE